MEDGGRADEEESLDPSRFLSSGRAAESRGIRRNDQREIRIAVA